jgi:competence protein ComEC
MAGLPGVEWVVASPPAFWMLTFHALMILGFYFYWPRPRPEEPSPAWKARWENLRKGRAWYGRAVGIFLLFAGAVYLWAKAGPQPLKVTYLSVGHGNAVVIRSSEGKVLVLDGGKENKGADRFHTLVTYLRHEGIGKVEGALLTHPDEDHVGGLCNLLGACPVGRVYESERNPADSVIYRRFEERVRASGAAHEWVKGGDSLDVLGALPIAVLHPSDSFHPRMHPDNNLSVATFLTYGGMRFLFPGDLEKEGLLRLINENPRLTGLDWLMAPHHGRRSGEPDLCAKALGPRFTVLSDGRDHPDDHGTFGQARPGAEVLSTALDGAVEVEVEKDGRGRWRTFREGKWHRF